MGRQRNSVHGSHDRIAQIVSGPEGKQRVNVDFPLNLLRAIDDECDRLGVPRQAWIKMACDERLRRSSLEIRGKAS